MRRKPNNNETLLVAILSFFVIFSLIMSDTTNPNFYYVTAVAFGLLFGVLIFLFMRR